ncbi:hypothetical protein [Actinoplanes sp. NPDC051859]|uniref:hypothetical protein n=1 Tax=Actinoplanes sp. NPDC051859 TaxID=3363909 RepID=UPI003791A2C1
MFQTIVELSVLPDAACGAAGTLRGWLRMAVEAVRAGLAAGDRAPDFTAGTEVELVGSPEPFVCAVLFAGVTSAVVASDARVWWVNFRTPTMTCSYFSRPARLPSTYPTARPTANFIVFMAILYLDRGGG